MQIMLLPLNCFKYFDWRNQTDIGLLCDIGYEWDRDYELQNDSSQFS